MATASPHPVPTTVVLFDLDGTLIDTGALIVASFLHTFATMLPDAPAPTPEAIRATFGEPLTLTFGRYGRDAGHVEELIACYRAFNIARHDDLVRRFPGALECVSALHAAGVELAIVTSKLSSVARLGLAAGGLTPFFDVLVGLDSVAEHKPSGAPALLALRLLGAEPGAHVLFVGDSHLDIACGRNAGCRTAAVGWTELDRAVVEAAGPHTWVRTPQELVRLVLGQE